MPLPYWNRRRSSVRARDALVAVALAAAFLAIFALGARLDEVDAEHEHLAAAERTRLQAARSMPPEAFEVLREEQDRDELRRLACARGGAAAGCRGGDPR